MGLEDPGVIDALSVDIAGYAVVNIFDSWDWEDPDAHLRALTVKLQEAASFVQSQQYFDEYPAGRGREVRIEVWHRYPIPGRCGDLVRAFRESCPLPIVGVETRYRPD